ncbi:YHYH domain-containing protein [Spiribacter roseus]|uniref:YHYH domain-containing protein n=1 Tax=Spiribacter roseus TaxID=1855875 RepID=UPI00349F41DA
MSNYTEVIEMRKFLIGATTALMLAAGASYAHTEDATPRSSGTTDTAQHSGGTDAYGCHTNHKTGVYHCH